MKKSLILGLFVMFFSSLSVFAGQEGAVAIAGHIEQDKALSNYTQCVADLKDLGVEVKEAMKSCTKNSETAASTKKYIAKQARKATDADRPLVIPSNCGWYGCSSNETLIIRDETQKIVPHSQSTVSAPVPVSVPTSLVYEEVEWKGEIKLPKEFK